MTDGPILLTFDFPARPPGGPEQEAALRALAEDIAQETGLLWKIWTASAEEKRAGGVYLFADRASAEAYRQKHAARLGAMGVTGIEASYREIMGPLTEITRGPVR
ncbi:monooxygenase [Roseomonas eburnea]|uniref:Monooxygenase n=1 Tax=Neoroseomonas eburnea TaxID=1346889 RepID=A0A9X9X7Q4_9PROT|nr:monooxygenase [Neoroseomonas eburnea]MBR0679740.1 monooxygenase [Neoroseomonas eburnea]